MRLALSSARLLEYSSCRRPSVSRAAARSRPSASLLARSWVCCVRSCACWACRVVSSARTRSRSRAAASRSAVSWARSVSRRSRACCAACCCSRARVRASCAAFRVCRALLRAASAAAREAFRVRSCPLRVVTCARACCACWTAARCAACAAACWAAARCWACSAACWAAAARSCAVRVSCSLRAMRAPRSTTCASSVWARCWLRLSACSLCVSFRRLSSARRSSEVRVVVRVRTRRSSSAACFPRVCSAARAASRSARVLFRSRCAFCCCARSVCASCCARSRSACAARSSACTPPISARRASSCGRSWSACAMVFTALLFRARNAARLAALMPMPDSTATSSAVVLGRSPNRRMCLRPALRAMVSAA